MAVRLVTYMLYASTIMALAQISRGNDSVDTWLSFKKRFNRTYSPEEDVARRAIFLSNLNFIRNANQQNSSTIFGITPFADMSPSEFANKFMRRRTRRDFYKPIAHVGTSAHAWDGEQELPASVDWEAEGATTAVHDENQNG